MEMPELQTPTPVGEVVAGIRGAARFLTGVTVTGGEATLQAAFGGTGASCCPREWNT